MLTLPALQLEPAAGPWPLEQPIELRLPAFTLDGQAVTQDMARSVGAFVYREAGGGEELWNEKPGRWEPAPGTLDALDALQPLPLAFQAEADPPWQGTWIAIGLKDQAGAARFAKSQGGNPRYRLRPFALLEHQGQRQRALGAPTGWVTFSALADTQRFAVAMQPESAQECESARFVLKNAALAAAGWLEVRASSGRQEVEIVKCDANGAPVSSVLLADDGSIRLRPGGSARIVLDGELEAQRVSYVRNDGSRITLN
ncbi:hypothetical protein [Ramlibacter sp. AN1133]|uniref:hypothetical protein n=1 Tax=Ramlibacter sp. AN1133 TaxID=3133429 RepID=UPI0030BFF0DC